MTKLEKINAELEKLKPQQQELYTQIETKIINIVKSFAKENIEVQVNYILANYVYFSVGFADKDGMISNLYSLDCVLDDTVNKYPNYNPTLKFSYPLNKKYTKANKLQIKFINLVANLSNHIEDIEKKLKEIDYMELTKLEFKIEKLKTQKIKTEILEKDRRK